MRRGDIVLVNWIFSDRSGSKMRPAVVVQADFLNARIADTVLVLITGTSRGAASTEVTVDPAVEIHSGLRTRSVISCTNFLTIDQALIQRTLGFVSDAILRQVEACLKTVLEIP